MIYSNIYPIQNKIEFFEYKVKFSEEIPKTFQNRLKLLTKVCTFLHKNESVNAGPIVNKLTLVGDKNVKTSGTSEIHIDNVKTSFRWEIVNSRNAPINQETFHVYKIGMVMAYNRFVYNKLRRKGLKQDDRYFWDEDSTVPIYKNKYRVRCGFILRTIIDPNTLKPHLLVWRKTKLLGNGNLLESLKGELRSQNVEDWRNLDFERVNSKFNRRSGGFSTNYPIDSDLGKKYQKFSFYKIINESIIAPGSSGKDLSIFEYHKQHGREIENKNQPVVVLKNFWGKELNFACSSVEEVVDLNKLKRETYQRASKEAFVHIRYTPEHLADETYIFFESYLHDICTEPLIFGNIVLNKIDCNNGTRVQVSQQLDISTLISKLYRAPKGKVFVIHECNDSAFIENGVLKSLEDVLNKVGWKHENIGSSCVANISVEAIQELELKLAKDDILLILSKSEEDTYKSIKKTLTSSLKIPTQFCKLTQTRTKEKLRKIFEFMIPQMAIKAGGVPFILESGKGVPEACLIGIDKYKTTTGPINESRYAGISMVSNSGMHLGSMSAKFDSGNNDKIINFGTIIEKLISFIKNIPNINHFIILRDTGRGTRTNEYEGELEILKQVFGRHKIKFAYVLANKSSYIRLFKGENLDGTGATQVDPFTFVPLLEDKKFVLVPTQIQNAEEGMNSGTVRPVEYEIFYNETKYKNKDFAQLLGYTLASLSIPVYESYAFTRLPAPLFYAHKLAKFVSFTEASWELNKRLTFI